ncbi:AAA family ATPase [Candidatus Peregrinibacteria bacterium]|nr:MAG: AAA family ATPase [Candidatus Peregrinibacteria bacterium]
MKKIDSQIIAIDKAICGNIRKFDVTERGLQSQNILSQLRNLIEHVALKMFAGQKDIENTYENIQNALQFIHTRGNLKFLSRFHKNLQITASHYTLDEENSERLMLKYFEYLIRIKSFLKEKYDLDILENIADFPIADDPALREYYEKIAVKIDESESQRKQSTYDDRYYIQKIKPFFIGLKVYYEITFTAANDHASKFDRIIAFTKYDIPPNYAVKLRVSHDEIEVFGKTMPIQIIDSWETSIRPCELNNFANIFGDHTKIQSGSTEYRELMVFLKKTGLNLVEIIDFSDDLYLKFVGVIQNKTKTTHFLDILDKCRGLMQGGKSGGNVIRYLLYRLNNKIIKQQYNRYENCSLLSDLKLKFGCKPFDKMPFTTSLIYHNPKLSDLLDCINPTSRVHELIARRIQNNTEIKGQLYTPIKDLDDFEGVDTLAIDYNRLLYYKHTHRKLVNYKDYFFIKGYEEDALQIIRNLKELSSSGIKNYSSSFESWLQSSTHKVDCEEKIGKLRVMFEKSEVAVIYGSAGTGKTTLINHISHFFNDQDKLFLANTNPAVDNLKRRVDASKSNFKTIAKFLSSRNEDTECDILIIDECSTVSNTDMLKVLEKASFTLLVLVGDIFQIESIRFGNWFGLAKEFIPKTSIFELTKPYRTKNKQLLEFWDSVRNIDDNMLEHITKNNYSANLNDSIFDRTGNDEIILCLNYDGLYGINNINKFLQGNNPNISVEWGVQIYKVGDPILFNESNRFAPLIYNNLKGRILNIMILEDQIQFDVEIDKIINQLEANPYNFELLDNSEENKSVIRFIVNKYRSTDEDDESSSMAVVPFQVAYAVSIHKAQGLEYDSVKIIITNEVEEMISHNIFYTAITRAKNKLKIYWTPETEKYVLESLCAKSSKQDMNILMSKYQL